MMIITAVERIPRRRSLVRIYLDGVAAFEIASAAARNDGLLPGRTLDQPAVDAIRAAEQRRLAMRTAAAMIARRPRSEREVRRRLALRKIDALVVDATVARLRELRLIDDADFARAWTESRDRASPRGQRLVTQELRAAGVDVTIASEAASAVDDEDAAYRLASSRMRSFASLDRDAFHKRLAGLLQRRGFGWDIVRSTIDRCWQESGADATQIAANIEPWD